MKVIYHLVNTHRLTPHLVRGVVVSIASMKDVLMAHIHTSEGLVGRLTARRLVLPQSRHVRWCTHLRNNTTTVHAYRTLSDRRVRRLIHVHSLASIARWTHCHADCVLARLRVLRMARHRCRVAIRDRASGAVLVERAIGPRQGAT